MHQLSRARLEKLKCGLPLHRTAGSGRTRKGLGQKNKNQKDIDLVAAEATPRRRVEGKAREHQSVFWRLDYSSKPVTRLIRFCLIFNRSKTMTRTVSFYSSSNKVRGQTYHIILKSAQFKFKLLLLFILFKIFIKNKNL
jgi:hypothetical protein